MFSIVFRALLGIVAFCFLSYGCIRTTVGMSTLPTKEEQIRTIEKEMQLIDIDQSFIPVKNGCFKFSVLKTYQCSKRFCILENIEQTKKKFIEIHEKRGWEKDVNDHGFYGDNNVSLVKNNMRAYCVFKKRDDNDSSMPANIKEYVLIVYKYRDGYMVK